MIFKALRGKFTAVRINAGAVETGSSGAGPIDSTFHLGFAFFEEARKSSQTLLRFFARRGIYAPSGRRFADTKTTGNVATVVGRAVI